MTDTYNGWRNGATWRVHLEIFDGVELRDWGWHKLAPYDLAGALREHVEALLEEENRRPGKAGPSLCFSYALAFLSDVDWREIAESMLAGGETESDEESESCE